MDRHRWAKKLYLNSGTKHNWNRNCSRIANKCGFFRRWVDSVNGYGWEWELSLSLGDVNVFDERKWKWIIDNKVKDYLLIKLKQGMGNKSTLKMCSEKVAPRKEIYYSGNKGSSLLFKARTNSSEVNDRTCRFNESRERICTKIGTFLIIFLTSNKAQEVIIFLDMYRKSIITVNIYQYSASDLKSSMKYE